MKSMEEFDDVTVEFKRRCNELEPGDAVFCEESVEQLAPFLGVIMNKRIDAYEVYGKKRKFENVYEGVKKNLLKTSKFKPQEKIAIFDEMFCCLAAFLQGNSYLSTITRCYYFHDFNIIEDKIMKSFVGLFHTFLFSNHLLFTELRPIRQMILLYPSEIEEFKNYKTYEYCGKSLYKELLHEEHCFQNNEEKAMFQRLKLMFLLTKLVRTVVKPIQNKSIFNFKKAKIVVKKAIENVEIAIKSMFLGCEEAADKNSFYTFGFDPAAAFDRIQNDMKIFEMPTRKQAYQFLHQMLNEILLHLNSYSVDNLESFLFGIFKLCKEKSTKYASSLAYFFYYPSLYHDRLKVFQRMVHHVVHAKETKNVHDDLHGMNLPSIIESVFLCFPMMLYPSSDKMKKFVGSILNRISGFHDRVDIHTESNVVHYFKMLLEISYFNLCINFFTQQIHDHLVSAFEYSFIYKCMHICYERMIYSLSNYSSEYLDQSADDSIILDSLSSYRFHSALCLSFYYMFEECMEKELIKLPELKYTTLDDIYELRISPLYVPNINLFVFQKELQLFEIKSCNDEIDVQKVLEDCLSASNQLTFESGCLNEQTLKENLNFINKLKSGKVLEIIDFDFSARHPYLTPRFSININKL